MGCERSRYKGGYCEVQIHSEAGRGRIGGLWRDLGALRVNWPKVMALFLDQTSDFVHKMNEDGEMDFILNKCDARFAGEHWEGIK